MIVKLPAHERTSLLSCQPVQTSRHGRDVAGSPAIHCHYCFEKCMKARQPKQNRHLVIQVRRYHTRVKPIHNESDRENDVVAQKHEARVFAQFPQAWVQRYRIGHEHNTEWVGMQQQVVHRVHTFEKACPILHLPILPGRRLDKG
jgi:hypothetical protein